MIRWPHSESPTESALDRILRDEGLSPGCWSNGPGDRYAGHLHTYHKVLYCTTGSIRFVAGVSSDVFELKPGDRLEIPAGTVHSALVGPAGCSCVEAARGG